IVGTTNGTMPMIPIDAYIHQCNGISKPSESKLSGHIFFIRINTEIYSHYNMVQFTTTILKFATQGEKTGWTYIIVPEKIAQQLRPGSRKSFRVKGKLDNYIIKSVALLPQSGSDFILAFNAAMRKGTGKRMGAQLQVQLQLDDKPRMLNKELMECMTDEPAGLAFFNAMPKSYQHYYSKWVEDAKTESTRTKRIALAVSSLAKKMNFSEMIRAQKKDKGDLMG
ncbi:MAG: YdeI/OmpD-associated family protein, partial [Bacteroidota bacterium]